MNCASQERTKVHTGRQSLPAAPKVLWLFVSHVAPPALNISLVAISRLLEHNTSLSALVPQTSQGHPEQRELPGTRQQKALLGSGSLKLDDLILTEL